MQDPTTTAQSTVYCYVFSSSMETQNSAETNQGKVEMKSLRDDVSGDNINASE